MLKPIERPILDSEGSDFGIPPLIGASLFKAAPKAEKKSIQVQNLDGTLCAVLRGILDVVQVPEDLARELENSDNAGRGAKWVHMEEGCVDTVGGGGVAERGKGEIKLAKLGG